MVSSFNPVHNIHCPLSCYELIINYFRLVLQGSKFWSALGLLSLFSDFEQGKVDLLPWPRVDHDQLCCLSPRHLPLGFFGSKKHIFWQSWQTFHELRYLKSTCQPSIYDATRLTWRWELAKGAPPFLGSKSTAGRDASCDEMPRNQTLLAVSRILVYSLGFLRLLYWHTCQTYKSFMHKERIGKNRVSSLEFSVDDQIRCRQVAAIVQRPFECWEWLWNDHGNIWKIKWTLKWYEMIKLLTFWKLILMVTSLRGGKFWSFSTVFFLRPPHGFRRGRLNGHDPAPLLLYEIYSCGRRKNIADLLH